MLNGNRTKSERGRSPRDFYITPQGLADRAIKRLLFDEEIFPFDKIKIVDAGCGTGVWGRACRIFFDSQIIGIDLEPQLTEKNKEYYAQCYTGDFLNFSFPDVSLFCGNPPFSQAESFVKNSLISLDQKGDGYILFLLQLSFLAGIKRRDGLFLDYPIKTVYVCSKRPSFFDTNGRHTTDTLSYAVFLWKYGWIGKTEVKYLPDWSYD